MIMDDFRWIHVMEDSWRIRINGREIEGRDMPADVSGPRRRFQPDVEVELSDAQVGPFRQMIADLEGARVSVGHVQGRFVNA
jgi:hypothetical protein